MKSKPLALLIAAAMAFGCLQLAKAEEAPPTVLDAIAEYEEHLEDSIEGALDLTDDEDDDTPGAWRRDRRHHGFRSDSFRGRGPADRSDYGPGRRYGRGGPHPDWRGPRQDFGGPGFRHHRRFGHHGMGHAAMMFGPHQWETLKLTPDQKAKVIDLLTQNYRAKLEAKMEMMEARRSLRELYKNDSLQGEALVSAYSAMGATRGKLEVLDRQLKEDLDKVLTEDQRNILKDLRKPRPPRDRKDGERVPGDRRPDRGPDRPGPRK